MKRTPIRVEPISGYLEAYRKGRRTGPIHPVVIAGEMVFISGLPPFDPDTGEIKRVPHGRALVMPVTAQSRGHDHG